MGAAGGTPSSRRHNPSPRPRRGQKPPSGSMPTVGVRHSGGLDAAHNAPLYLEWLCGRGDGVGGIRAWLMASLITRNPRPKFPAQELSSCFSQPITLTLSAEELSVA